MKRMIIILTIAAVLIGLSVTEIIFTFNIYGELRGGVSALDEAVNRDAEHIDSADNIDKAERLYDAWVKKKPSIKLFSNQTHINEVDNRLIKIKTLVSINTYPDCQIEMKLLEEYLNDLCRQLVPYPHSIV